MWFCFQSISAEFKKKLVRLQLIDSNDEDQSLRTLQGWIDFYAQPARGHNATTLKKIKQNGTKLIHFFGKDKPLHTITESDAEDFYVKLITPASEDGYELKENTTAKRAIGYCRQIFNAAVRKRLISINPFNTDSLSATVDSGDAEVIAKEIRQKVYDVLPSREWRLRALLLGVNGLRGASELNLLKWSDIDWANHTMIINSPKTKNYRSCGIMSDVFRALREAYDAAPEGQVNVVTPLCGEALRTGYEKFMKVAGVSFIQPIRSLRLSAVNDAHTWAASVGLPPHVIDTWFGHSRIVSSKYYQRVTDDHLDILKTAAVTQEDRPVTQGVSQQASAEPENKEQTDASKTARKGKGRHVVEPSSIHKSKSVGDIGFEPMTPSLSSWCSNQLS